MGWKDTIQDEVITEQPTSKSWRDTITDDTQPETVGVAEGLTRGAVQGVSMGAADELGAGAISGLDSVRRMLGIETGEEEVNRQLQEQGFKGDLPTIQDKTILSQYKDLRDTSRLADKKAQEEQGGAYLVGEVTGGLVPVLGTGGAGMLAAKGLGGAMAKGAITGGAYGGVSGLGNSEADLTEGDIGGVAKDTAIGAGLGLGIGGVVPVGIAGARGAKNLASKGADWLFDQTKLTNVTKKAAQETYQGSNITGIKNANSYNKQMNIAAEDALENVNTKVLPEIQDDVVKALDAKAVDVTKPVDDGIKFLDEQLKIHKQGDKHDSLSTMRNILQNEKDMLVKPPQGAQAKYPTESALREELDEMVKIEAKASSRINEANRYKTVNELMDVAAKLKNGAIPEGIETKIIKDKIDVLANELKILPDDILPMVRDVAKLKILRNKGDNGIIEDEVIKVIKNHTEPRVEYDDGIAYIYRGNNKPEIKPYRPDELPVTIQKDPSKIFELMKTLRQESVGKDPLVSKIGKEVDNILKKELEKNISPENSKLFKDAMKKYTDIYDLQDTIAGDVRVKPTSGEAAKMSDKLAGMFKNTNTLDVGNNIRTEEHVLDKIAKLTNQKDYANDIKRLADLEKMAKTTTDSSVLGLTTFTGAGVRIGATAGHTARIIGDLVKKVPGSNRIQKLSNATAQDLSGISKLYRTQGNERVANFLDELSTVTSSQKKNALLYSASQNQNLRDELFGDEE